MRMMDLTTLEGADTPGRSRRSARRRCGRTPATPRSRRSPPSACIRTSSRSRSATARGLGRQGRLRGDRVPVGPVAARRQARRRPGRRRARRRRDRHGDRPRRVPLRPLREGVRRDRAGEGSVRRAPPQGDSRDGRARHVRQRAPRLAARDGGRRRLHQDVDRQDQSRRHAARHALHARGDPRRPRRDGPHRRHEAGGRDSHCEAGDPVPRASSTRRSARRG